MNTHDVDLLLRSLDADLSDADANRLGHLLDTSAEAQAELAQVKRLRQTVARHGAGAFDAHFVDRVVRQVAPVRVASPGWLSQIHFVTAAPSVRWALAAVVVLCAVGLAFWLRPQTVHVPLGTTTAVVLPDGSHAELSPGSTLRYGRFASTRQLTLSGEAFFDVVHDERPFVVETFNARVVVRGTRFNVRAWEGDAAEATTVTLQSGRVEVEPLAASGAAVTLAPGEATSVAQSAVTPPSPAAVERALAWRTGELAFVDQPLPDVVRDLERRYAVRIELADAGLRTLAVTYLNPRPASAEQVLSDLCQARGLRYQRTANGFALMRDAEATR